ncbi:MAG TPA: hypothetical protein VG889_10965 [Rhizomicrobium sp.]|nr:hypothetical protein [Rhizomicrobium sp.]
MASITIRNLDDKVKKDLRRQAAENGRSMEEEAREILGAGVRKRMGRGETGADLFDRIHARFKPLGGFDMPEIRRRGRKLPDFE